MFTKLREFYNKQDVNIGRQKNVDFAKTIAIFGMILVHVFLYPHYGAFDNDGLSYFVGYILGGLMAAPVFMTSMGVGLAFSRNNEPKKIIVRGFKLIGMHYVLNILRSIYSFIMIVPYSESVVDGVIYEIFNGDILLFAGLALVLFGLLKMIKNHSNFWILISSLVLITISSIFKIKSNENLLLAYTLGIFIPVNYFTEPVICFQLCSWFIFVAFGYLFGVTIKKVKHLDKFYLITGIVAIIVTVSLFLLDYYTDLEYYFVSYADDAEYMVGIGYALISLGCVFTEFAILHFVSRITPKCFDKPTFIFSDAINEIYIVSWLIILNISYAVLRSLIGENSTNPLPYYISFIPVFILSTYLGIEWKKFKKKHASKRQEKKNIE